MFSYSTSFLDELYVRKVKYIINDQGAIIFSSIAVYLILFIYLRTIIASWSMMNLSSKLIQKNVAVLPSAIEL